MTTRVNPIQCIVPPHVLREIAQRGDPRQRAWALQMLAVSERFRGRREAMPALTLVEPTGLPRRVVYDAHNLTYLPGDPVRSEGDPPTGDAAVDEAYDGAGATYTLYSKIFERNSIDDRGMRLHSTVHYGRNYDNAFWDGRQMVYGDGDGQIFDRFTKAVDIIGHELTHGVVQHEAGLVYWDQPGALNESLADVFGSLVKQYTLGQTADEADWLIGEGLFQPTVRALALRSMKSPGTAYDDPLLGKDPQPAHMNDYQDIDWDNGGVHINSGIPNHAFYRAAMEIGGYAWEKAGRIWYLALRDMLRRRSDFQKAANITVWLAGDLYGVRSREQEAVRRGWEAVGITAGARLTPAGA